MLSTENVFLSTLQPHNPSTTYAVPSDQQLGDGSAQSHDLTRARRVQEQVRLKLAEKSTLPRQNGAASHYAMSDYGGSSTMKYSTYTPSYSSKSSYMYSGSKTMGPRVSHRAGFSSMSAAPDIVQMQRMSIGAGGTGGEFYREDMRTGGYLEGLRQNQVEQDAMSVHSMRNGPAVNAWLIDNSDAGSMVSEREGYVVTQYPTNGYSRQVRQGGGTMNYQTQLQSAATGSMRRSQSGTLNRSGTLIGGGTEVLQQQYSFKGPAHRTISRITNRNRMSSGSMSGSQMTSSSGNLGIGQDRVDRGFMTTLGSASQGNLGMLQRQGTLSRSMSIKSMHSVGKGMDIYQTDLEDMSHMKGFDSIDLATAVRYLEEEDHDLQALGSAYIQHKCYNENMAKDEVRSMNGIHPLVKLINSENEEVRRYSTGAIRNLIYENPENKRVFVEMEGISELNRALGDDDEELQKNITGILWNLSAKDHLKEKLAKETLKELTNNILTPMGSKQEDQEIPTVSPSKEEIFTNATGCIRNLSSGQEKTRYIMRDTKGLVGSLFTYLNQALKNGSPEGKGVENTVCILRNLSYQVYNEAPPSYQSTHNTVFENDSTGNIGCFSPNSRKAKKQMEAQRRLISRTITKAPKDIENLWHPSAVDTYHTVLQSCELNATTREAAIGALQNITSGNTSWAAGLCSYAIEVSKIMPNLVNLLHTDRERELISLTSLLRNLSRHVPINQAVGPLIEKLPSDSEEKGTYPEVVVNICAILNNMVIKNYESAKEILDLGGVERLMITKNTLNSSPERMKAAKAASTVLSNMYHYKKLHKIFKQKGLSKKDFEENVWL